MEDPVADLVPSARYRSGTGTTGRSVGDLEGAHPPRRRRAGVEPPCAAACARESRIARSSSSARRAMLAPHGHAIQTIGPSTPESRSPQWWWSVKKAPARSAGSRLGLRTTLKLGSEGVEVGLKLRDPCVLDAKLSLGCLKLLGHSGDHLEQCALAPLALFAFLASWSTRATLIPDAALTPLAPRATGALR